MSGKIILAGILWGFVGSFAHFLILGGLTVFEVGELRFLFSAITLGIGLLIYDKNLLKPKKIPWCFLLGAFNFATTLCYYKCIECSGVGVACVLLYTTPVAVAFANLIIYKKRASKTTVLAIIIVIVSLMVSGGVFSAKVNKNGLIFGVCSALCNACVTLIGKCLAKNNSLTVNFYGFCFSALIGVPFLNGAINGINFSKAIMATALAVFCTVIPYCLYLFALTKYSGEKASLICCIEPIVASVSECVIFKKTPTLSLVIAIVGIIISVFLIGIDNQREKIDLES